MIFLVLQIHRRPPPLSAEAEEGEAGDEPKPFTEVCNVTEQELLGAPRAEETGAWGRAEGSD